MCSTPCKFVCLHSSSCDHSHSTLWTPATEGQTFCSSSMYHVTFFGHKLHSWACISSPTPSLLEIYSGIRLGTASIHHNRLIGSLANSTIWYFVRMTLSNLLWTPAPVYRSSAISCLCLCVHIVIRLLKCWPSFHSWCSTVRQSQRDG